MALWHTSVVVANRWERKDGEWCVFSREFEVKFENRRYFTERKTSKQGAIPKIIPGKRFVSYFFYLNVYMVLNCPKGAFSHTTRFFGRSHRGIAELTLTSHQRQRLTLTWRPPPLFHTEIATAAKSSSSNFQPQPLLLSCSRFVVTETWLRTTKWTLKRRFSALRRATTTRRSW